MGGFALGGLDRPRTLLKDDSNFTSVLGDIKEGSKVFFVFKLKIKHLRFYNLIWQCVIKKLHGTEQAIFVVCTHTRPAN